MGTPEVGTDAILRQLSQLESDLDAAEAGGGSGGLITEEQFDHFQFAWMAWNYTGLGSSFLSFNGAPANEPIEVIAPLLSQENLIAVWMMCPYIALPAGDEGGLLIPRTIRDITEYATIADEPDPNATRLLTLSIRTDYEAGIFWFAYEENQP